MVKDLCGCVAYFYISAHPSLPQCGKASLTVKFGNKLQRICKWLFQVVGKSVVLRVAPVIGVEGSGE